MKRVLVIEDEFQVRNNIQQILMLSDFEAFEAEDGHAGIKLAKEMCPDLIICDIMMPRLDGYGVLKTLRQNTATANIPLIFLTAKVDRADLRQGMEMGADDYLTKPFTPDELLRAVASRLEKQAISEQKAQENLNELRTSIASALPHELITPLNGILGTAQLLIEYQDSLEPDEHLELAQALLSSGQRMQRLIENFLLYANLELIENNPERRQSYQNSTHISSTKAWIAEVALKKAQEFNREADLKIKLQNAVLQIPPQDLKKVTEELLDNAFKFSESGTIVRVVGQVMDSGFSLYIIDRGRGMTTSQIANIGAYLQFERKIYEQQGSGLGLAIAKRLVELYGGTFNIESFPHKQTIIHATFPLYTEFLPQQDSLSDLLLA